MASPTPGVTQTMSVGQAAQTLGISTNHARNLIAVDQFPVPVLRLGRVLRVPMAQLERYLKGEG